MASMALGLDGVLVGVPTLADHVLNVVFGVAEKQVVEVEADRIVATVEHPTWMDVVSACEHHCDAMNTKGNPLLPVGSANVDASVPGSPTGERPFDALTIGARVL